MYNFCLLVSIILFCCDNIDVSFSNKLLYSSSKNAKVEDIEKNMIIEFAKQHDIKHLTYYFDADESKSRKTLHQMLIKTKEESLFFVTKEISTSNGNKDKMNNKIKRVLHVYNCDTMKSLEKLVKSEILSNYQSKKKTDGRNHHWLIKIPVNKNKKDFQILLNRTQSDNDAKVFLYSFRKDHSVDIHILQTNEFFSKTLHLNYTWTQNEGFSSTKEFIKKSHDSLNGKHIKMVSAFSPPAVTYIEDKCSSKRCFKGFFADAWQVIEKWHNFFIP